MRSSPCAVECALDLHSVHISSSHHRYLTQFRSEPEAKKQSPDQQYSILVFLFALLYFIMNFVFMLSDLARMEPILTSQFPVSASLVCQWTLNTRAPLRSSATCPLMLLPSSCLPLEPRRAEGCGHTHWFPRLCWHRYQSDLQVEIFIILTTVSCLRFAVLLDLCGTKSPHEGKTSPSLIRELYHPPGPPR